ncbi:hypothetical protein C492_08025 [Natronococcus jeotgali DSM 18795]|uniref:Uncharacterized protein n=2 Tax=Natronococcus jeotgali TaxID=413812 RepID=L9XLW9_9EURY|nr:hypothetical protein C492_08025 [Natronococcus jeotgali DSM 18795]
MCLLFLVVPMSRDYDVAEHIAEAEEAAEDAVEEFRGYEDFADAIDAFAQLQIEEGNEVQMESDAEERAGLATDETERAAAIRETDVRHEVGQALHGLLQEYGYQPRQSFGADANARQEE